MTVDLGTPELHQRQKVENTGDGSRLRARVVNQRPIDALFNRAFPAITQEQYWAAERWWRDFEKGGFWLYSALSWDGQRGTNGEWSESQMQARDNYLRAGDAINGMDRQIVARHIVCFGETIGEVRRIVKKRHMTILDMLKNALDDLDKFYT